MTPAPDLPAGGLQELFASIGPEVEAKYQETRQQLLQILTESDSIQILSTLARLFAMLQTPGHPKRAATGHEIGQHHLEIAQALALTSPPATEPAPGRLLGRVEKVVELLRANGEAAQLRRFANIPPDPTAQKKAIALERMREHTQIIRGASYADQTRRYLQLVLRRIDPAFSAQYGVNATIVALVLHAMLELIEERLTDFSKRQSWFYRKKKPREAAREFVRAFPQYGMTTDGVIAAFAKGEVPLELIRVALVEYTSGLVADCFTLSADDIVVICPPGADPAAVQRVIDRWSLSFGDLSGQNLDHLHLDNPIWRKPFIRIGDGRWLWPTPTVSITFGFEMFEMLLEPHRLLLERYDEARGDVLESEVNTLLAKELQAGKVMRGVKWTDPETGRGYENDSLVAIDRILLMCEAKAGRITAPARRGAPDRLSGEIRKLMADPAEQSKRFMRYLSNERRVHRLESKDGLIEIDSRKIDTFVRVNVTFEPIGSLSSRWPELVEAGLIAMDAVQIPTISLGDLEIICRSLRSQAVLIHYLRRREDVERNAVYMADELDLIALYLATGFNIGDAEFGDTALMIYACQRPSGRLGGIRSCKKSKSARAMGGWPSHTDC